MLTKTTDGHEKLPEDGFCGIDLDDCIDDAGHIHPRAMAIVKKMASYAELSPSGKGIHIIMRAGKPGSKCKKTVKDEDGGKVMGGCRTSRLSQLFSQMTPFV